MKPTDVIQIKDFIGSNISIERKDGSIVSGTLSFFNWEQQVIHLCDYTIFNKNEKQRSGKFIIINSREWKSLEIGGEKK